MAVRKALALEEANLTAHLPMAGYRARVEGLERRGQDYRRFIELGSNSVAGHAQCAKGLDERRCFEEPRGQMPLN